MSGSELTPTEWLKVVLKYLSAFACAAIGGFRIARFVSGPGVTIVAYHRIIKDDHVGVRPYISVTQRALRRQIQFFKKHYSLTSLQDAVERITENRVDRNYLVITFDDGYRDNHDLGLDIFVSEGVRPAIFITTDCVEKRQELWPDMIRHAVYGATIFSANRVNRAGYHHRGVAFEPDPRNEVDYRPCQEYGHRATFALPGWAATKIARAVRA